MQKYYILGTNVDRQTNLLETAFRLEILSWVWNGKYFSWEYPFQLHQADLPPFLPFLLFKLIKISFFFF